MQFHGICCLLSLSQYQCSHSTLAEAALALLCAPIWGSANLGLVQGAGDTRLLQVSLPEGCIAALPCSFRWRQLCDLCRQILLRLLRGSLQEVTHSQGPVHTDMQLVRMLGSSWMPDPLQM